MATFNICYYEFFLFFNELKLYLPKEKALKSLIIKMNRCVSPTTSQAMTARHTRAVPMCRQMPQASEKGRVYLHFVWVIVCVPSLENYKRELFL